MPLRSAIRLGTIVTLALLGCSDAGAPGSTAGAGTTGTAGASSAGGGLGGASGAGQDGAGNGPRCGGAAPGAGDAGSQTCGSGGAAGGSAGGAPVCPPSEGLQVTRLDTTSIAEMGEPFDSASDDASPWAWNTNYGRPPEIVPLPGGEHLDILWQDHSGDAGNAQDENAGQAFVVRLEKSDAGYAVTRAYRVEQLARIMGFARDEGGNYYVATGVDEGDDLTPQDPAEGEHRPGIVKLIKFDAHGCKSLEIDAGAEREAADADSEPIINPMVAATSRLAYHGGQLALVHGINTGYDPGVEARHQKALTTHFDAVTGAVTRAASMWVSHSFDQRLFWDGAGFTELHLGDAFPRAIALGRFNQGRAGTATYQLFKPKGATGDNNTFTRLGGIAPIASGDWGYSVVFATDRGPETSAILNGTRDVAFLRVSRGFADMDEDGSAFVDGATTQAVTSSGAAVTNKLSWLTDYAGEGAQADRPRVAAIGSDRFVVLWERWTGVSDRNSQFTGAYGLVLGGDGAILAAPAQVTQQHLPRGDDLVGFGEHALFVTGDAGARKLVLHLVGADLIARSVEIP